MFVFKEKIRRLNISMNTVDLCMVESNRIGHLLRYEPNSVRSI